jgi:MFS family permease
LPFGVTALLGCVSLSTLGILGMTTVLGKLVFDITGSELDLGLLGLAEFGPTALLSPLTGTMADRFDRRRVAAVAYAGEAAAALALAVYASTDPTSIGPIFLIVIFFGTTRAFAAPAMRALPVDLAPPHLVERTVAMNAVAWQAGIIVGPVVAGFLYVVDPWVPFAATAVFLGGTIAGLLLLVPTPTVERLVSAPGGRAALRDAWEGLLFVRRTPILLGAISLDLAAVLFGGAVALLPAIAEDRLGVSAVGLGWLRAATGIGASATALVLANRPVARHVGRVLLATVGLFGAATILLGVTRSYAVAFGALLVLSGADAVSVYIRGTLVPLATPEAMRGRVLAVEQVFIGASNELGAFESGVAAHFLGLVGAVVTGGAATLGVVVLWWALFPDLRQVDRFAEVRPVASPGWRPRAPT